MGSSTRPRRWQSGKKSREHRGSKCTWSTWNYTWQPATFCASLLYCSWRRALKGTFIPLITKLVLDLMREICPFICAFFPSSSSYLKKRISITKALYISSLLLMMWPFAPIYLHGNKLPPSPPFRSLRH